MRSLKTDRWSETGSCSPSWYSQDVRKRILSEVLNGFGLGNLNRTILVAGLIIRIFLIVFSSRFAFVGDHVANFLWGMWAGSSGVLNVYCLKEREFPAVEAEIPGQDGQRSKLTIQARWIGKPNHPPLAVSLYWVQAWLLKGVMGRPVLNSRESRWIAGLTHTLFDFLLSIAVGALAARVFGQEYFGGAFSLTWLFFPFPLNSVFWGQIDVPFLVFVVVTILCLMRDRWKFSGFIWGLSLLFKPQAILVVPIILFYAFSLPTDSLENRYRNFLFRCFSFVLPAVCIFVGISLPWSIFGGLGWVKTCYLDNILHAYPFTTLKAFNIWYIDALRLDGIPGLIFDSRSTIFGISKDSIGRSLLILSLLGIIAVVWRRYRGALEGMVVFAALWFWSIFIWPTRVHERYIIYCLPFVIVMAIGRKRWLPVVVALFIVASAEHTWNIWMGEFPAGSLVTNEMIVDRYREKMNDYLGSPKERRASKPKPTIAKVRVEVLAEAENRREQYLEKRRRVGAIEIGLTGISIGAYFYALLLVIIPTFQDSLWQRRRTKRLGCPGT